jgi:hypothetical protein
VDLVDLCRDTQSTNYDLDLYVLCFNSLIQYKIVYFRSNFIICIDSKIKYCMCQKLVDFA